MAIRIPTANELEQEARERDRAKARKPLLEELERITSERDSALEKARNLEAKLAAWEPVIEAALRQTDYNKPQGIRIDALWRNRCEETEVAVKSIPKDLLP